MSQIPEVIELFIKHVKKGILPVETKNSFAIPAEWIKTLDPRIKERIRKDTRETLTERAEEKRAALILKLDERLAKDKINEETKQQKLWEFDTSLENRIQNEISKNIDKSHTYSLNLTNYRSSLRDEQVQDWKSICHCDKPEEALKVLDKLYEKLQASDPAKAQNIICSLDPKNALEVDIAREYLIQHHDGNDMLRRLEEILKKGFAYPRVKLEKLLTPKYDKTKKEDFQGNFEIIEKITFDAGIIHFREARETGMDLYRASKENLVTSKINIHQGASALAPMDLVCSTHYQIYEINENEVNTSFLVEILRSKQFLSLLVDEKNKGIKNEQGPDFLLKYQIPLPLLEVQREIVEKIGNQRKIIEGAIQILSAWRPYIEPSEKKKQLGEFVIDSLYGISSPLSEEGKYPVLRMNNLDTLGNWYLDDLKYTDDKLSEARFLRQGDFLFNRTNSIALVGKSGVIDFDFKGTWAGYLIRLRFNENLNPVYLKYLFAQNRYRKNFSAIAKPAGGQANINVTQLLETKIDYYPIEIQKAVIENLERERTALAGIKILKGCAEGKTLDILKKLWSTDTDLENN